MLAASWRRKNHLTAASFSRAPRWAPRRSSANRMASPSRKPRIPRPTMSTRRCRPMWRCASRHSSLCSSKKDWSRTADLDAVVDTYEHKIGPRNGARVVARAWTDPAYKKRLLDRRRRRNPRTRLRRRARRVHGGGREQPQGAQPGRLHALLVLSVAHSRSSPGLVQIVGLSLARGDRSSRRAARVRTRPCRTMSRFACGTARPRCDISCCPNVQRERIA